MSPTPQWVKDLKPSSPQGADLLEAERQKSNISVEKLSNFLFTKEVLERKQRILEILQAEIVFDKSQNYFDGRVEKFQTALARAKRLRQLQAKHNWDADEFYVANELISEPGPYGLHASMYLVSHRIASPRNPAKLPRLRFVTKGRQSSTSSSLSPPRTTKQLDVTHKRSWDMGPTFEGLRLLQPGTLKIKHSLCILRISLHQNGGLDHLDGQQIMPL